MSRADASSREEDAVGLLFRLLPEKLRRLSDPQRDVPRIAKDKNLVAEIENLLPHIPTTHHVYRQDAREMRLEPATVHLVVTSPPYWTLKEYNERPDQLGSIADYDQFLYQLDRVWRGCYEALVPGGRLVCVEHLRLLLDVLKMLLMCGIKEARKSFWEPKRAKRPYDALAAPDSVGPVSFTGAPMACCVPLASTAGAARHNARVYTPVSANGFACASAKDAAMNATT